MQTDETEAPTGHASLAVRTYPVIEIFGPTVQGEGYLAGMPTHFVRFGGCDYRCSWCDSMYAVDPERVRETAERLTLQQVEMRLLELQEGPRWVTLSGGNPALMPFGEREFNLYLRPFLITVETQGSVWRDWLGMVDHLTVSPKPPSSGMTTRAHMTKLASFMVKAERNLDQDQRSIKIVVFNDEDYAWAENLFSAYPNWKHKYLSVGTQPTGVWGSEVVAAISESQVRKQVGDSYAMLCEKVAVDPRMADVRVFPQLHVLAWGHSRGV